MKLKLILRSFFPLFTILVISIFLSPILFTKVYADDTTSGAWVRVKDMLFSHDEASSILLNDGRVLVVGCGENKERDLYGCAEIYNPVTGNWAASNSLNSFSNSTTLTKLNSGNILVMGLTENNDSVGFSTMLFNPETNKWISTGDSKDNKRMVHKAVLLPNGKVLVAGGEYNQFISSAASSLASAEIYDPSSDSWSNASSMHNDRSFHSATLLKNGKVLVAGGRKYLPGGHETISSSELYNYNSDTWNVIPPMLEPREQHISVLLPNGKVLVAGGTLEPSDGNAEILATAELYDPQTGQWSHTESMINRRVQHTATLLPNGKVLVTGGWNNDLTTGNEINLSNGEVYDPATGKWTLLNATMNTERYGHIATLLQDGRVFVAGGNGNSGVLYSAEILTSPALIDFKQNRNADGSLVPWGLQRLFNLNGCSTMAAEGCAITALADVIASYQSSKLPNGTSVDPGNLNLFLALAQNNGTHSGCEILFDNAGQAVKYTIKNEFPSTTSFADRIKHIDEALSSGNLVIVGVGGHFVVLYKKAAAPAADGSSDYFIADPFRYQPYATGDRSGKLLSKTYGSTNQLRDKLQVVVLQNKAPKPGKSWVIAAHSPVELLITDPNGVQTGYNTSTNTYSKDIPDSTYGIQQGLIDDEGILPPQPDFLYFGQHNPAPGTYTVQVIGTGSGPYTLDFAEANDSGYSSLQTIAGTASQGKVDTYIVTTSESAQQPVVNKEVTFEVLKADLNALYSQGQINNKGTYLSFNAQIESAETLSKIKPLGNKLAITTLKTFQLQLNIQKGKQLTENAYQILSNDVSLLIKKLGGS